MTRPNRSSIMATALICCCISGTVAAGQYDLPADRDNTLFQTPSGDLSNAKGEYLFIGMTGQGLLRRSLLRFDVAGAVPAGTKVVSATLRLTVSKGVDSTAYPAAVYAVTSDWGEGTSAADGNEGIGAVASIGDATWTHAFYTSQTWNTTGGDFSPTVLSSISVTNTNITVEWPSSPEFVAQIQAWLDTPEDNFGLIVLGEETVPFSARRFNSRESFAQETRPVLTVVTEDSPPGNVLESWELF